VKSYLVRFTAVDARALPSDAGDRLRRAIEVTPGIDSAPAGTAVDGADGLEGAFLIQVRRGIADAARDGSRMAKEALANCGLPDAQLVDFRITLQEEPTPGR
jgi:hypothetical protein